MPIQKGKRRRKPRGHGTGEPVSQPAPVVSKEKPAAKRPRFEAPMWFNAALGFGMLLFGIVFFAIPLLNGGNISTSNLVVLFLYMVVAGLYLTKAWRQRAATGRR